MPIHRARLFSRRRIPLAAGLAVALALGGCGDKGSAPTGATQVAVKVNDDEISIHQVNDILQRLTPPAPDEFDKTRREVLDKLVDQQLAAQQAVDRKLDRTPETILAIEAAKREILARAYLEQLLAVLAKPSQNDVRKFFADHPELFAERRIYDLQEVEISGPLPEAARAALREIVARATRLEDVVAWLKSQSALKFSGSENSAPAEQLPLELVRRLHAMADGQIGFFDTPQGVSIVRIAASRSEPIDEATALPQIEKFLENQARQDAIAREIKRLRDSARIEYLGDFGKPAARKGEAADINRTLEKGIADLK